MAAKRREPLDSDSLTPLDGVYGQRQVRQLEAFLVQLRTRERVGAHGNRRLFLSDLFVAQLLAFHHPIVRSLRLLDELSATPAAQQVLQCTRLPRSTVSDANKVVDPQLLQPLLADLVRRVDGRQLPQELDLLVKRLVAVDGTFLRVVTELLWTLRQRTGNHRVVSKPRLDVQLDVAAGVPRFAVLSGHDRSECHSARLHIEPGKIYVADKAYFGFDLLRDWLDGGADFVVSLNSQIRFTPEPAIDAAAAVHAPDAAVHAPPAIDAAFATHAPATAAADAPDDRVIRDRCGHLTGCGNSSPPTQRLREIVLRGKEDKPLRLLTSLVDPEISAVQIGELYRRRWQIELFFRWLKSCANFRHVISHSQNGLGAALYVALIATLLSAVATGRRPSKYTLAALQFVAAGLTELEQMLPVLDRFERERELARARYARRRAAKYAERHAAQ